MGRKPHPLLFQYYTRGAKVPDASNRYEYTCNFCGKTFPKGRPDTLSNHLIRYCPTIPDHERAALVAHGSLTLSRTRPQQEGILPVAIQPSLAHYEENEFHGLDALANASLAQPSTYPDLEELVARSQHLNYAVPTNAPDSSFQASLDPQMVAPPNTENNNNVFNFPSFVPELKTHSHTSGQVQLSATNIEPLSSQDVHGSTNPEISQETEPDPTVSDGQRAKVRKVRGAFSEERKREVDATRKSGACIRCRCLNKTCGLSDPCEQCQKISKASTWQYGCIRVKYGQTFHLFNLRLDSPHVARVPSNHLSNKTGIVRICCSDVPEISIDLAVSSIREAANVGRLVFSEGDEVLKSKLKTFLEHIRLQTIYGVKFESTRCALLAAYELAFTGNKPDIHLQSILQIWLINRLLSMPDSSWNSKMDTLAEEEETLRHHDLVATVDEVDQIASRLLIRQFRSELESSIDPQIIIKLDRRLGDSKEKRKANIFFAVLIILNAAELRLGQLQKLDHKCGDNASSIHNWHLPDTLASYVDQGERLAELYNIWTDCRHIVPNLIERDGTLMTADADVDVVIKKWFVDSALCKASLEERLHGEFNPDDEWSNNGTLWARLFLEKNPQKSRNIVMAG